MDYRYFEKSNNPTLIKNNFSWDSNTYKTNTSLTEGLEKWGSNFWGDTTPIYIGIGGIIFDIIGEYSYEMPNAITNNVVEKSNNIDGRGNFVYNDNVAVMPDIVTITAYVGECFVDRAYEAGSTVTNTIIKDAKTINALIPSMGNAMTKLKNTATNIINSADYVYQLVNNIQKALSGVSNQQEAFYAVQALRECQYPVSISLPQLGTIKNMMCRDVVWIQPKDTQYYSEVKFTFQKWRETAKVRKYNPNKSNVQKGDYLSGSCPSQVQSQSKK